MQLQFRSISECSKPDQKWLSVFSTFWPGYKYWLEKNGFQYDVSLADSKAALVKYMPKMIPTYNRLCKLVGNDALAHKFLTGWQPPSYLSACAQAVTHNEEVQLVRNYDYNANLLEGIFMQTQWNKKKVMGTNDCLIGLVDGMNDDGLAVSLTFGGRKEVGPGFGISFILRYVLEFCSTVDQAVKCLTRIPSHMSYNITVVDKTGKFKTVLLAPDKKPLVTNAAYSTNHQIKVDWPENAHFNKTIERSNFLADALEYEGLTNDQLASIFLMSPMYNTKFTQGFGTLYTAVYHPASGEAKLLWKDQKMEQHFEDFSEQNVLVYFSAYGEAIPMPIDTHPILGKLNDLGWQTTVADILINSMAKEAATEEEINLMRSRLLQNDGISWDVVADYWSNVGVHQSY